MYSSVVLGDNCLRGSRTRSPDLGFWRPQLTIPISMDEYLHKNHYHDMTHFIELLPDLFPPDTEHLYLENYPPTKPPSQHPRAIPPETTQTASPSPASKADSP